MLHDATNPGDFSDTAYYTVANYLLCCSQVHHTCQSLTCNQRPDTLHYSATTCTHNPVGGGLFWAATLIMQAPVSFEDEDELNASSMPTTMPNNFKVWHHDRTCQVCVCIDVMKNEVIPYDGSKTMVLTTVTGNVMLGMRATSTLSLASPPQPASLQPLLPLAAT